MPIWKETVAFVILHRCCWWNIEINVMIYDPLLVFYVTMRSAVTAATGGSRSWWSKPPPPNVPSDVSRRRRRSFGRLTRLIMSHIIYDNNMNDLYFRIEKNQNLTLNNFGTSSCRSIGDRIHIYEQRARTFTSELRTTKILLDSGPTWNVVDRWTYGWCTAKNRELACISEVK